MSATGDYIREAREHKGLTLGQVAEATRIPRYYLEILEGGGDDRLVSDRLYMVHFLRTYAAFLEVEEDALAAQFVRENRQPEPETIVPVKQRRSWKAAAAATLTVLLAIGVGAYLYDPALVGMVGAPVQRLVMTTAPAPVPPETPARQPSPVPAAPPRVEDAESSVLQPEANETDPSQPKLVADPPAPPPEPLPATAPDAPVSRDGPASPTARNVAALQNDETAAETPAAGEPRPRQDPAPGTGAGDTPPAPEAAALSGQTDASVTEASANHSLTIFAEQKSWLRVWVDGEPYKDMLLSPGTTRTLSAQTHFIITFGNAGGVRLTLNGEELPPAGTSGQVVRGFKLPPDP